LKKVKNMVGKERMNSTTKLLQLLGSPFALATNLALDDAELVKLYRKSIRNRMLFLYLETMRERNVDFFSVRYQEEKARYLKTSNAIARIAEVLTNVHVKYAVFKTIRPYKSTTVDLDILILEDRSYIKSIEAMQKARYKLLVNGPRSTTFWDKEAGIGIDLYKQVAVSFITYMNKQTLIPHVTTTKLSNNKHAKVLRPEADLACIITHSIIKEQMYTLSEYYTFIYYLKQMNINDFIQLLRQNNITYVARTHSTITATLHQVAHKTIPRELQQILDYLGEDNFEKARLIKNGFETPHKYHPITVARSLLEITKGNETRKSIGTQLIHMLNLNVSKDFLKKFIGHIRRETY